MTELLLRVFPFEVAVVLYATLLQIIPLGLMLVVVVVGAVVVAMVKDRGSNKLT